MADRQWLERRRQGWYAVVYVPPALHPRLGKKLRRSLGTRDLREAQTKRHLVVAEFKKLIEEARKEPRNGPDERLHEEAFVFREEMQKARRGHTVIHGYDAEEVGQETALRGYLADRAEQIAERHGPEAAAGFYGVATGTKTPLLHHLADWLQEGGVRGSYKPRTRLQLERDLRELAGWLEADGLPVVVETVDRRTAARFVTERLMRSGRETKTATRIISACRSYWVWMEKRGITDLQANPWDRQAPAKARKGETEGTDVRPFTEAEMVALLSGPADPELADAMRMAALSGMRIEEMYRLTVADCADGVFNVRNAKTKAGVRQVPIHPDLAGIVAARTKGKPATAFLFHEPGPVNPGRERSMAVSKRFGHYRQRDGVGVHEKVEGRRRSSVTFHSFRHWFTTEALRAGQPERVVQQVVGHKAQGVTLGVYFGGDLMHALRACVEAVRLPT